MYEYKSDRMTQAIDLQKIKNAALIGITGLGLPPGVASYSTRADTDGEDLNAFAFGKRSIQLSFAMTGGVSNAETRRELYRVFGTKKAAKFYYKDGALDVSTEVYTESIEPIVWTDRPTLVINLVAPYPFFKSEIKTNLIKTISGGLIYPLEILETGFIMGDIEERASLEVINEGQMTSPAEFVITVKSAVSNPTIILNDGAFFGLNYDFSEGEKITIKTGKGEKTAFYVDTDGAQHDLFAYISAASQWLQLEPGLNVFAVASDTPTASVDLEIKHYNIFGGVE